MAVAEPRTKLPRETWPRLNTSTKTLAWMRSSADWLVSSEPSVSVMTLTRMLQNAAWASGSRLSSPNMASGRSQEIPHGP
ncbi:hypothetical protein D3C87_2021600 [compost metagenome]